MDAEGLVFLKQRLGDSGNVHYDTQSAVEIEGSVVHVDITTKRSPQAILSILYANNMLHRRVDSIREIPEVRGQTASPYLDYLGAVATPNGLVLSFEDLNEI